MVDELASFTTSVGKLESLLRHSGIHKGGSGREAWLNAKPYWRIEDGELTVLGDSGGDSLVTYHTYKEEFFDEISGEVEAIVDVSRFLDFLDVVDAADGRLSLAFLGTDGRAEKVEFDGALRARSSVPRSANDYDRVPMDYPERYDDENRMLSPSGNPHQVFVDVPVGSLQRLIDAVDLGGEEGVFPITVEEDALLLDIGQSDNAEEDAIWGELDGAEIEWSDEPGRISNHYGHGFIPIFSKTLEGGVELQLSDGVTMAAVQDFSDRTHRFALAHLQVKA